jgi:hypothetical protein
MVGLLIMTTLRTFLDEREREIKDQIRLLKEELSEVRIARAALDPTPEYSEEGDVTIKDMIRAVLKGESLGLAAAEILKKIEAQYGKRLERTSLSPQLSRLRGEEEVTLTAGRWYLRPKPETKFPPLKFVTSDGRSGEVDVGTSMFQLRPPPSRPKEPF